MAYCSPWLRGAIVIHDSGTASYPNAFEPASSISVSGGKADFTGTIRSNVLVEVTGGIANFHGEIQNGAVFNLSGGHTLIDTVKNNATLNVSGSAELTLVQATGNMAILNLDGDAVLILDGENLFGNGAELNTSGGTILTQGNSFEFWEANLSGSTVIDLGGTATNINLGSLSGAGQLVFTNWSKDTVINFDEGSPIDPDSQLLFTGTATRSTTNFASPVPEPGVPAMVALLGSLGCCHRRRKRMCGHGRW